MSHLTPSCILMKPVLSLFIHKNQLDKSDKVGLYRTTIPIFGPSRKTYSECSRRWQGSDVDLHRVVLPSDITVVIPTYRRDKILIDTLRHVMALNPKPSTGIIVVDQTPKHALGVEKELGSLEQAGEIVRLRLKQASQSAAMNHGLLAARTDYVLFLDDDIIPSKDLIAMYADIINKLRHSLPECWCIVGQVERKNQKVIDINDWKMPYFPLNQPGYRCNQRLFIDDGAAGNMCVHRQNAITIGGFDENFIACAYKCDTEFARRVINMGGRVLFEPTASIFHLVYPTGGVRSWGDPQRTWKPHGIVGAYYLGLRSGLYSVVKTVCWMPIRSILTRHNLYHPWLIPAKFVQQCLGLCWALRLWAKKPQLLEKTDCTLGGFHEFK